MSSPTVAVLVASLGRADNLRALLQRLAQQTMLPIQVVLSVESQADVPEGSDYPFPVVKVFGPRGISHQRNRALDALSGAADVFVMYDDDFVPSRYALENMSKFFADNPTVMGADGVVLADGIKGLGIGIQEAQRMMDEVDLSGQNRNFGILYTKPGLYGCNMACRTSAVTTLRFDENLPLYAWLEDVDFCARIKGDLVRTDAFQGIHCGEKRGREKNGLKLGYSQVANPIYMVRKGTLPMKNALAQIGRNFAANHLRLFKPEPWIDRRGRAIGNWRALFDVFLRRDHPKRILDL